MSMRCAFTAFLTRAFIKDFSDFVAFILTRYDRILIVGHFSAHVCCPFKSMTTEFLELIEAFHLTQHVTDPTHFGTSVVGDAVFSDHSHV